MDTPEAIRTRRSIRQYLVKPVSRDLLQQVLTAAIYAPSACKMSRCRSIPALIDLHAASLALFGCLGDEGSADLSASVSDQTCLDYEYRPSRKTPCAHVSPPLSTLGETPARALFW